MNQAQQKLLDLEQRIEVRVQDIRASREWWPCRRGCDRCCRQLAQPPELSLQEWVQIDELTLENTGTFWHANGEVLPW